MDKLSYVQMGHISKEGMFLDQRVPTEKFKFDLQQIDWLDERKKDRIFDLVSSNIKLYGNLNPYALAVASVASVYENGEYTITKTSLMNSLKLLENTNYDGEKLSELIEKSDIIRYTRLYNRLETIYGSMISTEPSSDTDFFQEEYNEEIYNEYDEEYNEDYGYE